MAEGIARSLLSGRLPVEVRVSSAGASARDGEPASENARLAASEEGFDISGHRSRHLNATMVREASLIVTMTERHRETVGVIEPSALSRTVKLTDFCEGYQGDIADPVGGDLAVYRSTFQMIRKCVEGMGVRMESGELEAWLGDC
jgi:protein-tyrosine phosphatase